MNFYHSRFGLLPGTSLSEVYRHAKHLLQQHTHKTRRKPYIRSAYFTKRKVFTNIFWSHLQDKGPRERYERLKYFAVAVDLIEHSRNKPSVLANPNKPAEVLHRFFGITKDKQSFVVQIKENKRSKRLYLMSCFKWEK